MEPIALDLATEPLETDVEAPQGVKPASVRGPLRGGSRRVVTTVLFIDIVDSTRRVLELGDQQWLDLREAHEAMVRRELRDAGGRCLQLLGDGVLAAFESAAAGVRCAARISEATRAFGVEVRAGLHTGECEQRRARLGGIVFHVAARIMGAARAGEVIVSGTVKELVMGADLAFVSRGERRLRGLPGQWALFAVAGPGAVPRGLPM